MMLRLLSRPTVLAFLLLSALLAGVRPLHASASLEGESASMALDLPAPPEDPSEMRPKAYVPLDPNPPRVVRDAEPSPQEAEPKTETLPEVEEAPAIEDSIRVLAVSREPMLVATLPELPSTETGKVISVSTERTMAATLPYLSTDPLDISPEEPRVLAVSAQGLMTATLPALVSSHEGKVQRLYREPTLWVSFPDFVYPPSALEPLPRCGKRSQGPPRTGLVHRLIHALVAQEGELHGGLSCQGITPRITMDLSQGHRTLGVGSFQAEQRTLS